MYSFHYLNTSSPVVEASSKDDAGFDDLIATAAGFFPPDIKSEYRDCSPFAALSPFSCSSSSESSSCIDPRRTGHNSDYDSDVEELVVDNSIQVPRLEFPVPVQSSSSDSEDEIPLRATRPRYILQKPKPARQSIREHSAPWHLHSSSVLPSLPTCRKRVRRLSVSSFSSKDADYDPDDDSEGNATDDEYLPSPQPSPLKRRRASPTSSGLSAPYNQRAATSPSPTSQSELSIDGDRRPTKRARRPPAARNLQLSMEEVRNLLAKADSLNFRCPVDDYIQRNHRMPDFKRHICTHAESQYVCIGVPLEDAAEYGLPPDADQHLYQGEVRAGGCMSFFSRRDALKRHLGNRSLTCVGERQSARD
ncbi:hypothetical protein DXG03_005009 [Asterophora parasitica]|uniref:Uncharacterized protein n=1 Tax=Asterophora parasitica TaxID=117018 RepID=A0A9P7KH41_9AGAR|nr:hypothetical protein DXG03_005009 [Asterophora parasitica]